MAYDRSALAMHTIRSPHTCSVLSSSTIHTAWVDEKAKKNNWQIRRKKSELLYGLFASVLLPLSVLPQAHTDIFKIFCLLSFEGLEWKEHLRRHVDSELSRQTTYREYNITLVRWTRDKKEFFMNSRNFCILLSFIIIWRASRIWFLCRCDSSLQSFLFVIFLCKWVHERRITWKPNRHWLAIYLKLMHYISQSAK